jgi:hypothetical protein
LFSLTDRRVYEEFMGKHKTSRLAKVGDKFTINSGVELEVVYVLKGAIVGVVDKLGTLKEVRAGQLAAKTVNWESATLPYARIKDKRVGQVFKLNCGITVKIVRYENCYKVLVEDEEGNSKTTGYSQLKEGSVSWREFIKKDEAKKEYVPTPPSVKVGDEFVLTCGVVVKIEEYINTANVTVVDTYGNRRRVGVANLKRGNVSWAEFGFSYHKTLRTRLPIGSVLKSKFDGEFSILRIYDANRITIQWVNTGHIQENCKSKYLYSGSIRDTSLPKVRKCDKYYVYFVYVVEELVYIGKGKGNRFLHPTSGKSSCAELNRHFFLGDRIETVIQKEGLTDKEASALERESIKNLKPKYNKVFYKG